MTIQEMKNRKKELGYTNQMIADLSGVPLSTVNKLFSGATASPRRSTLLAYLLPGVSKFSMRVRPLQKRSRSQMLRIRRGRQLPENFRGNIHWKIIWHCRTIRG